MVTTPKAAAGYDTAGLAYVVHEHRLDYFAYHSWVAPPAILMAPLIVQALEQCTPFFSVVDGTVPVVADLRLDTELVKFRQVFEGDASWVELVLRIRLLSLKDAQLVTSRIFSASEPVGESTPYAGVLAANRAIGRLLDGVAGFVAAQVSQLGKAEMQ